NGRTVPHSMVSPGAGGGTDPRLLVGSSAFGTGHDEGPSLGRGPDPARMPRGARDVAARSPPGEIHHTALSQWSTRRVSQAAPGRVTHIAFTAFLRDSDTLCTLDRATHRRPSVTTLAIRSTHARESTQPSMTVRDRPAPQCHKSAAVRSLPFRLAFPWFGVLLLRSAPVARVFAPPHGRIRSTDAVGMPVLRRTIHELARAVRTGPAGHHSGRAARPLPRASGATLRFR